MINKFFKISLIAFSVVLIDACSVKKISWDYELICQGVGGSGTELVKCYSYGKTFNHARKQVKRDAVHGYLFKGVSAKSNLCSEKPPVCHVSYEQERKWFDNFFKSEDYLQYVTLSNDGNVSASDRIKMPNGKYKVGFTVAIKSDLLRKRMEKEGYAKGMHDVFDN